MLIALCLATKRPTWKTVDIAKYQHMYLHHFNQLIIYILAEYMQASSVADPVKCVKMTEEPAPKMDEDKLDFEGPDAEEVCSETTLQL